MLPDWLRHNAAWRCRNAGNELRLEILEDAADWENIFRVQLIPEGELRNEADITVNIRVGVELPEGRGTNDPYSFMITDKDRCVGIQLLDPSTYNLNGPYRAIEGEYATAKLRNPILDVASTINSTANINPDQFELSFKPSEMYGSAFCSIDSGHKIVALYSDSLRLSDGLWLDLYRFESTKTYVINYIEIEIYKNSPALKGY